jgi:hypothetical protein
MADYNISWQSNGAEGIPGKTTIVLPENQKNDTSTSLTLTGKNFVDYGEIQQENFIRMLENFASATPPTHATIGQLWYDTSTGVLKVRTDYSVDSWANLATIPNLNGNSGKVLSNDGTTLSWVSGGYTLPTASTSLLGGVKIDGSTIVINNGVISVAPGATIPSQTGNNGKFLTTDGSALSWANIYESPNFAKLNADQTFTGTNTFTQGPVLSAGAAGGLVYLDSNKKMASSSSLTFNGMSAIPAIAFTPTGSSPATIDTDANRLEINSSNKKIAFATSNGNIIIGEGTSGAVAHISAGSGLGTAVGAISDILKLTIASTNTDNLRFFKVRTSNGNDWTSAGYRIQSHVDATSQAYIQFNGGNDSGISIGTGDSTVSPLGVPERLRIDQLGNVGVGTAGAVTARLDVRAEAGRTSLFLSDNINSSLAIKHEGPGSLLTYESTGATQQRWVVNGQQVMKLDNPVGSLNLYRELLLRPAEGSTDIPDIIWMGADDTERHRLYEDGTSTNLWYRKNGGNGSAGAIHYDGNTTSTYVSFQSAYGFTNGQGWTNDSNYTDVFPPAGYTMANLQSYIASIGGIHFNGSVDNNDSIRCIASPLGDRIRIYVQGTEQRDLPSANFLAIWRR